MVPLYSYGRILCGVALVACAGVLHAQDTKTFDAAEAFGARADIEAVQLSPDGTSLVFIHPVQGQGGVAYTQSLAPGAKPKLAFYADGKPLRMQGCNWVSNDRLACRVHGVIRGTGEFALYRLLPVARMTAVNADGTNPKPLGVQQGLNQLAVALSDSEVVDWLPGQDGSLLMARTYVPTAHLNSHIGQNDRSGLGVDLLDTRTGAEKQVVVPRQGAIGYLSDGHGTVRIVAESTQMLDGRDRPETTYLYRMQGAEDWHELSRFNPLDRTGFQPVAVDHDLNVAYGWKKLDGRLAVYSMSLDGALKETLVFARPDVDVGGLVTLGRSHRVVGVSYSTDVQKTEFFAPDIKELVTLLHQALPKEPNLRLVDASLDESKLLVYASSDDDYGAYYVLDRQTHSLHKFLETRARLQGVTLAHVRPVTFPAADGRMIPGYLTLPPGVTDPRGMPAIVLPHGDLSARDTWGFDWLAQFYAARGYVVLQPEFRGAYGYGDAWFLQNGYQSWNVAVGDVVSAGRWLVSSGIADASKLGIVGWSYGGYAALQSVAVDPTVFKAIVAIAPVSDLSALVGEHGFWGNYFQVADFVGNGAQMHDGSPINHVDKFKQPVLLFHGTLDRNVSVQESIHMAAALHSAGAQCDLVTYEDRDHSLEDSEVRADMLRKSDAFLRRTFGLGQ